MSRSGLAALRSASCSAPIAAVFYREPRVAPVVAALAVPFVITAAGVIHQAQLERRLRFRAIAGVDLIAAVIGIALAVVNGPGGCRRLEPGGSGRRGIACCRRPALWIVSGWRPSLRSGRAAMRTSLGFGAPLTGFSAVNYLARNADYALIGRVAGEVRAWVLHRRLPPDVPPAADHHGLGESRALPGARGGRDTRRRAHGSTWRRWAGACSWRSPSAC